MAFGDASPLPRVGMEEKLCAVALFLFGLGLFLIAWLAQQPVIKSAEIWFFLSYMSRKMMVKGMGR